MSARGVIPAAEGARLRSAALAVTTADTELRAAVRAAWRAGGSVREIAAELGKSTRTIQDWLAGTSRAATPQGYAALVDRLPTLVDDPSFAVRAIRETVLDARALTDRSAIDHFHADPGLIGSTGWDALIAGVAMMTGLDRTSAPEILAWCNAPSRTCAELFDPLEVAEQYRWLDYLRTPIELQVRNIILASGNLEGI
jgi:hypothetical protein